MLLSTAKRILDVNRLPYTEHDDRLVVAANGKTYSLDTTRLYADAGTQLLRLVLNSSPEGFFSNRDRNIVRLNG